MKARQLIEALSAIDPETLVFWEDYDSEYDTVYVCFVDSVDETGYLNFTGLERIRDE